MKTLVFFPAFFCVAALVAQKVPAILREADFTTNPEGAGIRFNPVPPPMQQVAGAPPAYFTCFWEFGDGSFSTEKSPLHVFASKDSVESVLHLTYHYDDGEMPKKKKKPQRVKLGGSALADAGRLPDVFTNSEQAIALKNNREPRSREELTLVLSYRNNGTAATDGSVHLFFNEKKFPNAHFQYQEARTHFGETPDPLLTSLDQGPYPKSIDWTALSEGICSAGESAPFFRPVAPVNTSEMLADARGYYRDEKAWRFRDLRPGETRNMFISLDANAAMLRDTSAFIHLQGVFVPEDPAVAPDSFRLDMEIVSSHDPNTIAVSDTRVGYRKLKKNRLDYKVRFQNNGERQAEKIALTIDIPEGLNTAKMQPLDWYPKCPICPKPPFKGSCLDTATFQKGIVFTFRNIYLPGSNQRGVADQDSTKGFVTYRIVPEKGMPKRTFRSRASIVFDKNPAIRTNYSKTRFKTGFSPGLKLGYGFSPDSLKAGYVFFGASMSPFKSWKIYPQLELLTGIKGRSDLASDTSIQRIQGGFSSTGILPDTVTYTIKNGNRRFLSFEVPVLLRRNFSRFIGVGLGASARVLIEKGEDVVFTRIRQEFFEPGIVDPYAVKLLSSGTTTTPFSRTSTRFAFFGDLTLGSVRIGPNVGVRAGGIVDKGVKAFVEVSVEWKL